ncbi:MAG: DUF1599 domain-containing protein [Ferruginibacter sp.]|nr:DUF1599 domain-containing protein [Ferruginibacter sp.]
MNTTLQYDGIVHRCREIFLKKTADYGTSWRVYRPISVADQIYIKARRIKTIQEKGIQRIGDDIRSEFEGIFNYCIIGLIQLQSADDAAEQWPVDKVAGLYADLSNKAKGLMEDKNHDYGEAWREMSQESFVDLILAKVLRIKQIIANEGKTQISEGIDANFFDIANYSIFGLILIEEGNHK